MYPYEPHSGTHPAPYWLRDDCHSKHYRDPYMNSFSCDDQLPLFPPLVEDLGVRASRQSC